MTAYNLSGEVIYAYERFGSSPTPTPFEGLTPLPTLSPTPSVYYSPAPSVAPTPNTTPTTTPSPSVVPTALSSPSSSPPTHTPWPSPPPAPSSEFVYGKRHFGNFGVSPNDVFYTVAGNSYYYYAPISDEGRYAMLVMDAGSFAVLTEIPTLNQTQAFCAGDYFFGMDDGMTYVWKIGDFCEETSFAVGVGTCYSYDVDTYYLYYGGPSTSISIFEKSTWTEVTTISGGTTGTLCVRGDDEYVYRPETSGSQVYVWSVGDWEFQTNFSPSNYNRSAYSNTDYFFVGDNDGTLRIYDKGVWSIETLKGPKFAVALTGTCCVRYPIVVFRIGLKIVQHHAVVFSRRCR